ncbi:MAG TPA: hypothetical protein VFR85_03625 [Anaeromyxobacteraceae bacterium]|nr:hypothetical protein [Anaeromyxobacteraceae bacterium]
MRDRRWDFLYDRQRQPLKAFVLERFAESLAEEIAAWPPPFVEWLTEDYRRRYQAGMAERPRQEVVRFALAMARLDLLRQVEALDEMMRNQAPQRLRGAAEEAAAHLLSRLVSEKCLSLKEWAEGARLSREDLARAVEQVERRFGVEPGE